MFEKSGLYCSNEGIISRLASSIKEPAEKRRRRLSKCTRPMLNKPHRYPLGTKVSFHPVKPRNYTLQINGEVKTPLTITELTERQKRLLKYIRSMRLGRVKNAFECEKIIDTVGGSESYLELYREFITDLHANMCSFVLKDLIKDGDRVLDFGCGPGSSVLKAIMLNGKNVDYTGLDLQEKIIEQNRIDYPTAKFVQCRIPYELDGLDDSEKFDHVTASFFFHGNNLHEKVATLLYINSVLKKGGKITALIPRGRHDANQVLQILKGLGYRTKQSEIQGCYGSFHVTDEEGIEIPHYCYLVQAEKVTDHDTRYTY